MLIRSVPHSVTGGVPGCGSAGCLLIPGGRRSRRSRGNGGWVPRSQSQETTEKAAGLIQVTLGPPFSCPGSAPATQIAHPPASPGLPPPAWRTAEPPRPCFLPGPSPLPTLCPAAPVVRPPPPQEKLPGTGALQGPFQDPALLQPQAMWLMSVVSSKD